MTNPIEDKDKTSTDKVDQDVSKLFKLSIVFGVAQVTLYVINKPWDVAKPGDVVSVIDVIGAAWPGYFGMMGASIGMFVAWQREGRIRPRFLIVGLLLLVLSGAATLAWHLGMLPINWFEAQ